MQKSVYRSGERRPRPIGRGFARLLAGINPGDVVMVTRLDRLARSTGDLSNTLAAITAKKAGFKSLGDTWADARTSHGRLILTAFDGLGEFERDLTRTPPPKALGSREPLGTSNARHSR